MYKVGLMTKNQTLDSFKIAKKYHELQMVKIGTLISGRDVIDLASYYKEDCNFGRWIYENEAHLRKILGAHFYETLEQVHEKWHEEYQKIYEIIFSKPKRGEISKNPKKNKVTQMDLDKAAFYYTELKLCSQKLLKTMVSSERRIMALSEAMF